MPADEPIGRRTRPARRRDLRLDFTPQRARVITERLTTRDPAAPTSPAPKLPAWLSSDGSADPGLLPPAAPTVDFSHTDAMTAPGVPGDGDDAAGEDAPTSPALPRTVPITAPRAGTSEPPARSRRRNLGSMLARLDPGWRLDLGRRLRAVAGVDEALLARVPQERARYTALGGVVIGTALIAAFSMWFAIGEALGRTSGWIIVPTLIWGLFIFNFDRWLVSSAMGARWHKRLGTLLVRVLMAVLFGIIIAEPLVLRVFQTAIVAHIQDGRTADLATLQSNLLRCNPAPDDSGAAVPTPANCNGYVLTFPTSPGSAAAELASKQADAAKLSAQIDADTKQLSTIENEARMECAGDSGPGLTGKEGVGPNCTRLRQEADAYAKAHPIATETAQLGQLQQQISALEAQVASSQSDFLAERANLIGQAVATAKSHQGAIGLIERMGALSALTKTSLTLLIGVWLVRLLFIMVDCMPVLVKFFGGVTTYDRLVERQLMHADMEHAAEFDTAHEERAAQLHRRRAEIDVELREHRAALGSRVSRAVHDLATEYVEPNGTVYRGSFDAQGRTAQP